MKKKLTILHIEDDPNDKILIKEILKASEYEISITYIDNEKDYIYTLNNTIFDLILSDFALPSFNGLDALKIACDRKLNIPFIFVSGTMGEDIAIESLKNGATDYVQKDQLKRLPSSIYRAINENDEKKKRFAAEKALKESNIKLNKILDEIVNALSSLTEQRDPYISGHQHRSAIISSFIAKELNLSEEKIQGLRIASLLHDIGKVHLPTEILNKPGKLSAVEFELIKTHPQVSYEIIKNIEFPWPVAKIILQHHERLDGSGYPNKLKSNDILIEAKILGVADVIEAMSSHRPYRPALGIEAVIDELIKNKGTLYDPQIVDICLKLYKNKKLKF